MFQGKQRPSGMEFASCHSCNFGTSAADSVAAYFAKLDRASFDDDWKFKEAEAQRGLLNAIAPGFLDELYDPTTATKTMLPTSGGILVPQLIITANGPLTRAYLKVFGAKMGMALYREHVGEALPLEGEVFVTWSLNVGFRPEISEGILNSLPGLDRLEQGKKTSQGQFDYRFKTDRKTIVIAQSSFHTGLNILSVASSIPGRFSLPSQLTRGGRVCPGELLSAMPSVGGHGYLPIS
ncbi:hypothetical protein [Rhizobium leguminosarum]|uniref:hypothetical protein n=1 Tax=Rhizobium leguminosarum TaxID=384 RepID=UPI0019816CEC|nr:hypothetical protein [Rhizobium leguminosarum]NKL66832.1 hypothetical protein [Rhizobium leguminosarum bv. viciae]